MDESMNTQPRDIRYLNATSMMNNWWFRVAIRKILVANGTELYFEHPAVVGTSRPGWMTRMKAEGLGVLQPNFAPNSNTERSCELHSTLPSVSSLKHGVVTMTRDDVHTKITAEEFREQGKDQDWFVVDGEVYNAKEYLKEHPGGADSILLASGDDATDDFVTIHSDDAKRKLAEFHIGTLVGNLADLPAPPMVITTAANAFLDPKIWKSVTLSDIQAVTHDSFIYRFSLPLSDGRLGLPVGQHVYVRLRRKDTQELIQRAYTPVSKEDDSGTMDILIKYTFL
ncbi:hypothetical protein EIP86_008454 [Pleurotus ostreatoroseus]|nr:hypothetical protein EIP86_008454 [Pleurotus ostreatoroseus]